jgi:polyisoprenoid-binding protein YceI
MQTIKPFFIFLIAITFVSCGTAEKQEANTTTPETTEETKAEEVRSYTVNTEKSKVQWKGSILSVKAHEGTINFESGKFTTKGDNLMEGTFVVDMSSMVATDENYQPEEGKSKEKLIGHLSSPDFFDVAQFPKAMLTVVDGNATLTVRGHAKGVELKNVTMSPNGDNVTATAEFTFNRQDFGVAFDMGAKDMAISDEIVAKVSVVGLKS